jgi:hypothetical protein
MRLLWSTSFRSFGKSNENDIIQKNFLSSLISKKIDLTLFVTQFGELGVEDEIKNKQLKYIYRDVNVTKNICFRNFFGNVTMMEFLMIKDGRLGLSLIRVRG